MNLLKKEFLFFFFLVLSLILLISNPISLNELNSFISWSTIRALFILLTLTTALKLSNIFDNLAIKSLKLIKNEKSLAIVLITISAFLSMFLTNDITLFIIVPLTLAISSKIKNDISKLIFFEAISVNVGSLLTPTGNPQNLFLFREWDISVIGFIKYMFPIWSIKLIILYLFAFIIFKKIPLQIEIKEKKEIDKKLFIISLSFFILYLIALEFNFVRFLIPLIILTYFFIKKEVLLKVDYFLIATFILMFIDFNILAKFEIIKNFIYSFNLNFLNVMNLSLILSQFMSNVPAAIFMSRFSNDYLAIAYGVNIAGSGVIIASLANIIAVRFLNNPKQYLKFHLYSIPYIITSYTAIYFYLKTL